MRFPFLVALITSIALAGVSWYHSTAHICPVPLTYRLGQLDNHFTITREEAKERLAEAEGAWEEKTGRELFEYRDDGRLVVNFVFDDRQADANSEIAKRQTLDAAFAEMESLRETLSQLEEEYASRTNAYEEQVASYDRDLKNHNQKVSRYNNQGGAPAEVFRELEQERQLLDSRQNTLNQEAGELNELGQKINEIGQQSNQLVESYNQKVEVYNAEFGYAKEFTQGDYQNGVINMYTFSSPEELVTVLVHEFGHALGIDHVDDENAVMYYLLREDESLPVLNDTDLAAFTAVCGTGEERVAKVRRLIREFIHNYF